jgi:hypothetical protein
MNTVIEIANGETLTSKIAGGAVTNEKSVAAGALKYHFAYGLVIFTAMLHSHGSFRTQRSVVNRCC